MVYERIREGMGGWKRTGGRKKRMRKGEMEKRVKELKEDRRRRRRRKRIGYLWEVLEGR